jgi:hypothetical protein
MEIERVKRVAIERVKRVAIERVSVRLAAERHPRTRALAHALMSSRRDGCRVMAAE